MTEGSQMDSNSVNVVWCFFCPSLCFLHVNFGGVKGHYGIWGHCCHLSSVNIQRERSGMFLSRKPCDLVGFRFGKEWEVETHQVELKTHQGHEQVIIQTRVDCSDSTTDGVQVYTCCTKVLWGYETETGCNESVTSSTCLWKNEIRYKTVSWWGACFRWCSGYDCFLSARRFQVWMPPGAFLCAFLL